MSSHTFPIILVALLGCCRGQVSISVGPQDAKASTKPTPTEESVTKPAYHWKMKPQDGIAAVNETIWSNCVAETIDQTQATAYEWMNENGDVIPAFNSSSNLDLWVYDNGTLTVRSFSKDFAGRYTCAVGPGLQETVSIRLGRPVVLGNFPETLETFVGCNITMVCRAKGDGVIEGSWLQGENVIDSADRKFINQINVNDTSQFILHILHSEINDSGVYMCEATNAYDPSAKKSITVVLMEKPENSTCPDATVVASAPQIDDGKDTMPTAMDPEKNFIVVYIVPAVIVGTLLLIAIIIAILLIVRKRRQQQNAIFSGVKYRRTEGNEESIRA